MTENRIEQLQGVEQQIKTLTGFQSDCETAHSQADDLLLKLIMLSRPNWSDEEWAIIDRITDLYSDVEKYYS